MNEGPQQACLPPKGWSRLDITPNLTAVIIDLSSQRGPGDVGLGGRELSQFQLECGPNTQQGG